MASKPFAAGHILAAADVNDLTGVINRAPTEVDVVNTTTETNLFFLAVPAAAMSTDRMLRLTLGGDILKNTSAVPTVRFRFGSTFLWQTALTITDDADRRPWSLVAHLQNINSASVQRLYGTLQIGDATPAAQGLGSAAAFLTVPFGGVSAENSAGILGVSVTLQWDGASANGSWRNRLAVLELL